MITIVATSVSGLIQFPPLLFRLAAMLTVSIYRFLEVTFRLMDPRLAFVIAIARHQQTRTRHHENSRQQYSAAATDN